MSMCELVTVVKMTCWHVTVDGTSCVWTNVTRHTSNGTHQHHMYEYTFPLWNMLILKNIPCMSTHAHAKMGWYSETSYQILRNSTCINICVQSHMWQNSPVSLVWRLCLAMAHVWGCLYMLTYDCARKGYTYKQVCKYQHMPVLKNITYVNITACSMHKHMFSYLDMSCVCTFMPIPICNHVSKCHT